ncbi:cytochrome c [Geobacter sp. OR-1]|uniref:selenite/tellurite reduction operon c-type cytochrome lipoprotein ExtS n=1 Tax=Geobacter sp. OR-1 TaxID=1266765 RepID=UPI0005429493|nr:selenite/tellurite reduction operon c-type cytochrome lipoprotein ExtS [Geobacter sp. OR-1]GAM09319.1 cytochrome c [Geobacter sp. OR-1]
MAVRLAFLIAVLAFSGAYSAMAASSSCLKCHQPHYMEIAACIDCHGGDDRTLRKNIAHLDLIPGHLVRYRIKDNEAVVSGGKWLELAACRRCHNIRGKGNHLAADLDRLSGRHPARLLASIITPVEYMPDFRFDRATASLLVNAVLASAVVQQRKIPEAPVNVRFKQGVKTANVFEQHCGACHKILTGSGGFGRGNIGPNLSGLLSIYYPKTGNSAAPWSAERLEGWLRNPRKIRPLAKMPPVQIDKYHFEQLLLLMTPVLSPQSQEFSR